MQILDYSSNIIPNCFAPVILSFKTISEPSSRLHVTMGGGMPRAL